MNQKESLWKAVITSIHNLNNKPIFYIARKTANDVWCNISKVVNSINDFSIDRNEIFTLIRGSRVKILLLKDSSCGKTLFQVKFPNLYLNELVKCCLLEYRFSTNGFSWMWKFEHRGATAELSELLQLYNDIGELTNARNSKFGFRFNLNSNGQYFVKSMRKLIESKLILYNGQSICWLKLIPLKVFIWRASMGKNNR